MVSSVPSSVAIAGTIVPASQLEKLTPADGARLRRPVFNLAFQPRPSGATLIVGSSRWRIRIGDLRVIHEIDDSKRLVIVTKIARRSESTYRRL
jgi:mRNA interferase RelE/StbE